MTTPLITLAGDTPRARHSDPTASHLAADRSSFSRRKVLIAALIILREDGPMTGSELNDDYRNWRETNPRLFPMCHFDTPRRRVEEAAKEFMADIIGHSEPRKQAIYRISPEGRSLLEGLGI